MCGIFGYWDRARPRAARTALAVMAQKLVHRGPDDEGIWHQPQRGVAIGNRRLSIIDIGGGHQPFVSDDGQVAVVQNGEIFNYVELAAELRRPGRHAAHRIRHRSHPAAVRARRHFLPGQAQRDVRHRHRRLRARMRCTWCAIASASSRCTSRTTARAPCSAPKSRRCCPGPAARRGIRRNRLEAIHHYLTFNYIPAPWTIWRGVRHVMPGTWMKFTRSGVQTQRWWNLAAQREQRLRVRRLGRGVHGHPG